MYLPRARSGGGGAWLPAGPSAWPSLAWGEHSIVFYGMSSGGRYAGWVLMSGWCAWFGQYAGMWGAGWGWAMGAAGSLVLGWGFVRALFLARCSLLLCCRLLPGGGFACAWCRGAVGGGRSLGVGVGGGGLEVVPEFCCLGGVLSAGMAAALQVCMGRIPAVASPSHQPPGAPSGRRCGVLVVCGGCGAAWGWGLGRKGGCAGLSPAW